MFSEWTVSPVVKIVTITITASLSRKQFSASSMQSSTKVTLLGPSSRMPNLGFQLTISSITWDMIRKEVVFARERIWVSTWKGNDQYKQSFSIRLRNAAIRFTVIWCTVWRVSGVCFTECAMGVAIELCRIIILHHALFFFWDVILDVSSTWNAWFYYGIWGRHALKVRHIVLLNLLFVLRIIFLLFYLLVNTLSDLLWRTSQELIFLSHLPFLD